MIHDVAMSLSPSWGGTRQVRLAELAGDVLILLIAPAPDGPAAGIELRWLREEAMSFGTPAPQYRVKGRDL